MLSTYIATALMVFIPTVVAIINYRHRKKADKRNEGLTRQINNMSRDRSRIQQELYEVKDIANQALDLLNQTKTGEGEYTLKAKLLIGEFLKKERYQKLLGRPPKER